MRWDVRRRARSKPRAALHIRRSGPCKHGALAACSAGPAPSPSKRARHSRLAVSTLIAEGRGHERASDSAARCPAIAAWPPAAPPASETAPAAGLEAALSRLAVHLVLGSCRRLVATSPAQRLRRSSEVGAIYRVCIANRLAPGTLHLGVPRRHRDLSRVAPGAVIRLAFDRPIDGVETAAAPAACVAVTPPAFEAVHRRPASTDVLPPPDFSLCSRPSPFPGSQSPRTTLCGGLRTSGPHAEQPSTMQRPCGGTRCAAIG